MNDDKFAKPDSLPFKAFYVQKRRKKRKSGGVVPPPSANTPWVDEEVWIDEEPYIY